MPGKKFSRRLFLNIFSYFSLKIGFDISCKLSPRETICLKDQSLFSGENKKNVITVPSAELAQRMVKSKQLRICMAFGRL